MQITGQIIDLGVDAHSRKTKISVILDTKQIDIVEKLKNENKLDIKINKHREKRSLNANSYFWKLLQEICDYQGIDTVEDYKRRVKQLGIFRQFRIEDKNVKTFEKMWSAQGTAWFCEIFDTEIINNTVFKIINAYYGSSSFNTKQMSRLIDGLVQDCRDSGIETKTQAEINSLLESWDKK